MQNYESRQLSAFVSLLAGQWLPLAVVVRLDPGDDLPNIIGLGDDGAERRHRLHRGLPCVARIALFLQIDRAKGYETKQGVGATAEDPNPIDEGRTYAAAALTAMTPAAAVSGEKLIAFSDGLLVPEVGSSRLPFGADATSWRDVWFPAPPGAAGAATVDGAAGVAVSGVAGVSFPAARAPITKVALAASPRLKAIPHILTVSSYIMR